jgi:hypothetical protein
MKTPNKAGIVTISYTIKGRLHNLHRVNDAMDTAINIATKKFPSRLTESRWHGFIPRPQRSRRLRRVR